MLDTAGVNARILFGDDSVCRICCDVSLTDRSDIDDDQYSHAPQLKPQSSKELRAT